MERLIRHESKKAALRRRMAVRALRLIVNPAPPIVAPAPVNGINLVLMPVLFWARLYDDIAREWRD